MPGISFFEQKSNDHRLAGRELKPSHDLLSDDSHSPHSDRVDPGSSLSLSLALISRPKSWNHERPERILR